MGTAETIWGELVEYQKETALLGSIQSLLAWDERTGMPSRGGEYRAEQVAYLAGKIHQRQTSPQLGEWLESLGEFESEPHSDAGATVRELRRQYRKLTQLPQRLVEELTRAEVLGQQAWVEARRGDDFACFSPYLETNLRLRREQADAIGFTDSPYDVLLDDYEPGETTSRVAQVLSQLRDALVPMIAQIADAPSPPEDGFLRRHFPVDQQRRLGKQVAKSLGFDFSRGRLDETDHPFCTEMGPHDHRILTRYDYDSFNTAFFGTLHEAGHGIYDQGLRPEQYGLPSGSAVSLGIHESQSRLWENMVGRSAAFWDHWFPQVQQQFPQSLGSVSAEQFYAAVNRVRPSLIRVEADEATYNLHIVIRFELERALLEGDLPVAELPGVWRDRYESDLGVRPPNDADGVLQDVHWSAALFGYFPTYSLGNLYAAHWMEAAGEALGDLEAGFRKGDFLPLRRWLGEQIYRHGQCYSAAELLTRISNCTLSHEPLLNYLKAKLGPIYGLDLAGAGSA